MRKNITIIIIFILVLVQQQSQAQGCSDAGVCSASQHIQDRAAKTHQFRFTESLGLGDQNVWIFTSVFSYRFQAHKNVSLGLSIPYSVTAGNITTTNGIGDIIINTEVRIINRNKSHISLFLAGKLATSNANKKNGASALPMVYQQSSGTNDIIGVLNWNYSKWLFALGYQHAFNANTNEFLAEEFPMESPAAAYHSSAFLLRGDDVMLRIQKVFYLKNASKIKAGLLPIFRIQQDEIKKDGKYQKVENSNGLTLNLYVGWNHRISKNIGGEIQIAAPPITREVRADGTTRTFVVNYIFSF